MTRSTLEEVSETALLEAEDAADAKAAPRAAEDTSQATEDTLWADRPDLERSFVGDNRWVEQGELRERNTRVPNYLIHASVNSRATMEDLRAIAAKRFCSKCGATLRDNRRCRKCEPKSLHLYRKQSSGISVFQGHVAGCYLWGEFYAEARDLWGLTYGAVHRQDWFLACGLLGRMETAILAEHELSSLNRTAQLVAAFEGRMVSKDTAKSALDQVRKDIGVAKNVELRAKVLKGLWYLGTDALLRSRPGGRGLPMRRGSQEALDLRELVGAMFAA